MEKGIFITGTGTDVGKTYVTALLIKQLKETGVDAAYYKAAVSGNQRGTQGLVPGDAVYVKQISGISQSLDSMVPYIYEEAISPHLAARREGSPVDLSVVLQGYDSLCQEYDFVVMEGSGGVLCPLRLDEKQEIWLEDIIKALNLPCLVVADSGLGTINATLLTLEYLSSKHIITKGVILNHFHPDNEMEQDNRRTIARKGKVPVVACVPEGATDIGKSCFLSSISSH